MSIMDTIVGYYCRLILFFERVEFDPTKGDFMKNTKAFIIESPFWLEVIVVGFFSNQLLWISSLA